MAILDADLRRVPTEGELGSTLVPFRRPSPDRSLSADVSLRPSAAVDMLVEEIAASQPLPPIAAQVLQIAEDTRFSAHELAQAISSDPASTCLVLRLANSPYYSLPCRVATVRDAVVLLGFHQVSALVVTAAVMRSFTGVGAAQLLQFWRHALAVGLVSEAMARADRIHCDTALTAGFLHNIGLIALAQVRPEVLEEVHARAVADGVPLHAAERELLGVTDTEVGAALLSRWGLCPDLVSAVRAHVDIRDTFDDASLAALLARARAVVEMSGLTDGVDRMRCSASMPGYAERHPIADGSFSVVPRTPLTGGEVALAQTMSRVEAFLDHAGMACVEGY